MGWLDIRLDFILDKKKADSWENIISLEVIYPTKRYHSLKFLLPLFNITNYTPIPPSIVSSSSLSFSSPLTSTTEMPRVLLLGPTQSGKRQQCRLLSKTFPNVPIIDVNDIGVKHSKEDLKESGCFCFDGEGRGEHVKKVEVDFFDTVVLLKVPEEILIERWHER